MAAPFKAWHLVGTSWRRGFWNSQSEIAWLHFIEEFKSAQGSTGNQNIISCLQPPSPGVIIFIQTRVRCVNF